MAAESVEDQVIIKLHHFLTNFENKNPFHSITDKRIKLVLNKIAECHLQLRELKDLKKNIRYHQIADENAVNLFKRDP